MLRFPPVTLGYLQFSSHMVTQRWCYWVGCTQWCSEATGPNIRILDSKAEPWLNYQLTFRRLILLTEAAGGLWSRSQSHLKIGFLKSAVKDFLWGQVLSCKALLFLRESPPMLGRDLSAEVPTCGCWKWHLPHTVPWADLQPLWHHPAKSLAFFRG